MDKRMAPFIQLQRELQVTSGDRERIHGRIRRESALLQADREYRWRLEELRQLTAELESLKQQI